MQTILEIDALNHRFGDHVVLTNIDLGASAGERIAILGPNGSGKTTLLRCIAGTVTPTAGSIRIAGHRAGSLEARDLTGVSLSQERSFYLRLSGRENLLLFARLNGLGKRAAAERVDELAEELELSELLTQRAERGSSGQLQQLAFALVRAAAYLVIAVVALDLPTDSTDWPGVAAMLLTASLAFAPIGVLGAAATIVFKRGGTIAGLLVFAMTFVSGALFPLSLLPEWLQAIGRAMPTRFAFDGLRAALFENGGWETDAVVLLSIAIVAVPISVWVFARALAHAKRSGTLAQY